MASPGRQNESVYFKGLDNKKSFSDHHKTSCHRNTDVLKEKKIETLPPPEKRVDRLDKSLKEKCMDIEKLQKELQAMNKQLITKDEEHNKMKQRWRAEAKDAIQNIRTKYELVLAENKFLKEQADAKNVSKHSQNELFRASANPSSVSTYVNKKEASPIPDSACKDASKVKEITCRVLKLIYDLLFKLQSIRNENRTSYEALSKAINENCEINKKFDHAENVFKILGLVANQNLSKFTEDVNKEKVTLSRKVKDASKYTIPHCITGSNIISNHCNNRQNNLDCFTDLVVSSKSFHKKNKNRGKSVLRILKKRKIWPSRSLSFVSILKEFGKQNVILNSLNQSIRDGCKQKDDTLQTLSLNLDKIQTENSNLTNSVSNLEKDLDSKDMIIEKYKIESSYLLEKFNQSVESKNIYKENNEKLEKRVDDLLKIPEMLSSISELTDSISDIRSSINNGKNNSNSKENEKILTELITLQQQISQEQNEKDRLVQKIKCLESKVKEQNNIIQEQENLESKNSKETFEIDNTEKENQLANLVENLSLEKEILSSRVLILETIREEVEILRQEKSLIKSENIQLRKKLEQYSSSKPIDNKSNGVKSPSLNSLRHSEFRTSKENDLPMESANKIDDKHSNESLLGWSRHDSGCVVNLNNNNNNKTSEHREETLLTADDFRSTDPADYYYGDIADPFNDKPKQVQTDDDFSLFNDKENTDHDTRTDRCTDLFDFQEDVDQTILRHELNDTTVDYNRLDPNSLFSSTFSNEHFQNEADTLRTSFSSDTVNNYIKDIDETHIDYDFEGMLRKFENTLDEMQLLQSEEFKHAHDQFSQLKIHDTDSFYNEPQ